MRSVRTRALRLGLVAACAVAVGAADLPVVPGMDGGRDDAPAPTAADVLDGAAHAGVASVDASWHVGASAGQFTDDEPPFREDAVDPHGHSWKKRISDGLGTRVFTRALVVEDGEGDRVAIVANDLYLPQDLLTRRVAGILAEHDRRVQLGLEEGPVTGIGEDNLATTASHNHNTPYYSTPSWGVWLFQDVVDLRFYEYMAQRMAEAVIAAASDLVPVRMGGATVPFNEITSHTYGPQVADDGTPAGQPYDYTTGQLSVVRLDDVSDAGAPQPLAAWVVFGVHPEWTWGDDLINGDVIHSAMRMVDRELGLTTVMSQRETGTSGPHKGTRVHEPAERREYQEGGFDQADRAGRMLASRIEDAWRSIDAGSSGDLGAVEDPGRFAPFATRFDVAVTSQRFAPPATRPYPGVSNCNTAALFHGDPRLPILGLPDCVSPAEEAGFGDEARSVGEATAPMYEELKRAGVPVPESYSPTKLTAVEETAAVHLMALKLGTIGVTFCPCEQFTAQALNIESRLDRHDGLYLGFDWSQQRTPTGRDWCVPGEEPETWVCANPRDPAQDLPPVSDLAYRRMRAQIWNDAAGWEEDLATLGSEAEPYDPDEIKGNFTHEEFTGFGYDLVLAVGMANDYWGYVPEYREYRSHDHYRKALSGLGPHGTDYLATRLSRMAAGLNGAPGVALSPLDLAFQAESARASVVANGLGELASAYEPLYRSSLPTDGGAAGIVSQPGDIARFDGTHVVFVGGSNYVDLPQVRVERLVDGAWVPFADQRGEVPLMVDYPRPEELPAWRAGEFAWRWTASFEAFASDIEQPDARGEGFRATPEGTYRFVIDGVRREATGGGVGEVPYHLESEPFEVRRWEGITASDLRVEPDGRVSFQVGPVNTYSYGTSNAYQVGPIDYPDTYDSPFVYLHDEEAGRRLFTYGSDDPSVHQQYCWHCTFEPWLDEGEVASATVLFESGGTRARAVPAEYDEATGRWVTTRPLPPGRAAWVPAEGIVDPFGNVNGEPSAVVRRAPRP